MINAVQGWDEQRQRKWRTTTQLRAMLRNGAEVYHLADRYSDVMTGIRDDYNVTEDEYLVAIRRQLGIGMIGLQSRGGDSDVRCGACKHHGWLEPEADQHWATGGCPSSKGHSSQRHSALQSELYRLQRYAKAGLPKSRNVTDYSSRPTPASAHGRWGTKHMDTVIEHDEFEKKIFVDFTVKDVLSQSSQKSGDTAPSIIAEAFKLATNQKARAYGAQADADGAILLPFAVDSHGAFCPRDPDYNPEWQPRSPKRKRSLVAEPISHADDKPGKIGPFSSTQPKTTFSTIFDDDSPPRRGRSRLSCEEGLIIRLSKLATDPEGNGFKPFNLLNRHSASAGMLARQTYRKLARVCIIHSARATLKAMRRSRAFNDHGSVA